jgi:hypothetical protein
MQGNIILKEEVTVFFSAYILLQAAAVLPAQALRGSALHGNGHDHE